MQVQKNTAVSSNGIGWNADGDKTTPFGQCQVKKRFKKCLPQETDLQFPFLRQAFFFNAIFCRLPAESRFLF